MDNKYVRTGWSQDIRALLKDISAPDTTLFVVYYGSDAPVQDIYRALKDTGRYFLGCTDAGRFTDNHYLLDSTSIAGMSLSGELFEKLAFGTVDMQSGTGYDAMRAASRAALEKAAESIRLDLANPDMGKEFVINLLYGLNSATPFLEGQALAGMMLQTVGGSSGGKTDFKISNVMCHLGMGNIGAFGLFRLNDKFSFLMDRVSSFRKIAGKELVVTKTAAPRHILEFNGKPAAGEYCRLLNLDVQALSPDVFARYTLGIEPGDNERLITSIMKRDDAGNGFLVYNDVFDGLAFNLYESMDQAPDRQAIYSRISRNKVIAFLSFDCILCYLARNTEEKTSLMSGVYAKNLQEIPKIGFGTFSENICGANINQTETFLALYSR